MINHYTPLSFNTMLCECVGHLRVARSVFVYFIFCAGQTFYIFSQKIISLIISDLYYTAKKKPLNSCRMIFYTYL